MSCRSFARAAAVVLGVLLVAHAPAAGTAARPQRTAEERAAAAARLRDVYRGRPETWPAPDIDPGVDWRELGLLPNVVHPEANPFTAAKAELGRTLFHDPGLSPQGTVACVSCHDPRLGWADGREVSAPTTRLPGRNTPTIRNTAFQQILLWDGRAASLEEHAANALTNPREMSADRDQVERFLAGSVGYRDLFATAFPDRSITFAAAVDALACFERTVVGGRSRFDAYLRGDRTALSDAEILGLDLFRGAGRCMNCHHGPNFSDGRFHDLGLSFHGRSNEDLGRFDVTGDPADKGRFRTPSLRDVTATTPLMHTGMFRLRGVLNMYNAGMVTLKRQPHERTAADFPVKSAHLKPLDLNPQDLLDLEAFLGTLEEPRTTEAPPALPSAGGVPITAGR